MTNTTSGLLQIATIYSETFQQFLAVRALFGLFMGGELDSSLQRAIDYKRRRLTRL